MKITTTKNTYDFRHNHKNYTQNCNVYDFELGKLCIRIMKPFGLAIWWDYMPCATFKYPSLIVHGDPPE